MRYRIHYEIGGGEDFIDIEGETVEEIREQAEHNMKIRGVDLKTAWSEEI